MISYLYPNLAIVETVHQASTFEASGVKNIFVHFGSGTTEITIDEIAEINEVIQHNVGSNANINMSVEEDITLGDSISVAIIAS